MRHDSGQFQALPNPPSGVHSLQNLTEPEAGGVALDDLAKGTVLEVETRHHTYNVKNLGDGRALISGHPEYCPEPTGVDMLGSVWGGNSLRLRFIGKGARLEFWHPVRGIIRTSTVLEVREQRPVA